MEAQHIETKILLSELYTRVENLSKHNIEDISRSINQIKVKLFPKNKLPIYGNLSRSLDDDRFYMILGSEKRQKIKLCYLLMYFTGLRESESILVKVSDIDENWILKVHNIKCKRTEYILIPECIREQLSEWINLESKRINASGGYLFFSEFKKNSPISKNKLRNMFRELTLDCGLNEIYGKSKDGRNLYKYCLHSLRYSFGVRFYHASGKDIVLTSQALRHRDLKTTMIYLRSELSEVNKVMNLLR